MRKLEWALVVNGPSWFGYDWIYAYYGIEGHKRKGHAAKSYCLVDKNSRDRLSPYLKSFFEFKAPAVDPDHLSIGSRLVLKDHVVKDLMQGLTFLTNSPIPDEPDRVLARLTTVSALTHVAFLLLTGLRNNPMDAPSLRYLTSTSDWELIYQKQARVVLYVPPLLRVLLGRSRRCYGSCLEQIRNSGYRLDYKLVGFTYGFVELDTVGKVVAYTHPCHRRIIDGLIAETCVAKYAGIPRNAFRHWANSRLRESGQFSEATIRAFMWHSDEVLHPLTRTRLERVVAREMRDQIAGWLAAEAGIQL